MHKLVMYKNCDESLQQQKLKVMTSMEENEWLLTILEQLSCDDQKANSWE